METTEYPIVSTEKVTLYDESSFLVTAEIVNLGICKIVTLNYIRLTAKQVGTSWTEVSTHLIPSNRQDLFPVDTIYFDMAKGHITFRLNNTGKCDAIASASFNGTWNTTVTYVTF